MKESGLASASDPKRLLSQLGQLDGVLKHLQPEALSASQLWLHDVAAAKASHERMRWWQKGPRKIRPQTNV